MITTTRYWVAAEPANAVRIGLKLAICASVAVRFCSALVATCAGVLAQVWRVRETIERFAALRDAGTLDTTDLNS